MKKTLGYLGGNLIEEVAFEKYLATSHYRDRKNTRKLLKDAVFTKVNTALQKRECKSLISAQAAAIQKRSHTRSVEQYARALSLFYNPQCISADLRVIADRSELHILRNSEQLSREEKEDFLRLMLLREIDDTQLLDREHSLALDLLLSE